jgi:hypothetical protein
MAKLTFAELTDCTLHKLLQEKVLQLSIELQENHGGGNMEVADVMVEAAHEMARRGRESVGMEDSFDCHIVDRCKQALGHLRNTYC